MQPIQILLSQKQKTFSQFFTAFLKFTLNLEHSRKKDDPNSRCISEITVSEKGDWINVCKIPFKRSLTQKTWEECPVDCLNLHNATFTIFVHPCKHDSLGKSLY